LSKIIFSYPRGLLKSGKLPIRWKQRGQKIQLNGWLARRSQHSNALFKTEHPFLVILRQGRRALSQRSRTNDQENDVLFYPGSYRRPYRSKTPIMQMFYCAVLNRINFAKKPALIRSRSAFLKKVVTRKELDKTHWKLQLWPDFDWLY
jgi:hypothetical protein